MERGVHMNNHIYNSQELFETIVKNAMDGFWIADLNGKSSM